MFFLLSSSGAVYAQYNASLFSYCDYFCPGGALPVTGLELEGNRLNESTVALKWKTRTTNRFIRTC